MTETATSEFDTPLPPANDVHIEHGELETALHKPSPLFYGLGTLGYSIPVEAFGAFVYFYYVDGLGLAFAMAALVRTVYAVWDAANDLLFGHLSDNTRTRWGRRRPWMLITLPLYILCFILVFFVPEPARRPGVLFWYLLGITFFYESFSTIISLNYSAMFPELFQSFPERVRAGAYNRAGLTVGLMIGLALTPLVYRWLGFQGMALLYGGAGGGLMFVAILQQKELPTQLTSAAAKPWAVFFEILRERPFRLYALTLFVIAFVFNLFPLAIPFYVKYALGAGEGVTALIFGISLAAALGGVPIWVKLFHRWGTAGVFLRAAGIVGAAYVWLGLVPNLASAALATVVLGFGWAGCQVCFDLIRAGLVDRHYATTGRRSEAFYYSLLNFSVHISGLLQALAMFAIGILFGYVSGEQPGPAPGEAFRFLVGVFPAAGTVLVLALARRFFNETAAPQPPPGT